MSRLTKLQKGMWHNDLPIVSLTGVLMGYYRSSHLYFRTAPGLNQLLEEACRDLTPYSMETSYTNEK